jgi:tetratricopeptide (TPR) repeat protein
MQLAFGAYDREDLDEAELLCRAVIAADTANFDAHHLLGVVLTRRGSDREALASYDRALAIVPGHVEALSNRGVTLNDLRRYREALASLEAALAIRPDHVPALSNRGGALCALGRFDEALASYDKARAIQPDFADCRFNRALLLLLLRGASAEGWREYEWRRRLPSWVPRHFTTPEWHGEDLRGKRLLLYAEQGLGDTLQFARFAPRLAEHGAAIVLEVQPSLARLMAGIPGVARIVRQGEPLPAIDCHLPLMSVPLVLGLDEARIPSEVPYLRAEPTRVAAWAAHLPDGEFRIGIAWQGNPRRKIDRGRSIPLATLAPLAAIPGVRLVSLQKHAGVEQLAELPLGMQVATLGPPFDSGPDGFLDTASVMMHLDLVLTSDNTIAHLAGALGRPVWVMLKDVPDWRWMLDRPDTPWYPTARLFRQTRRDDWDEVIARATAGVAALVNEKTRRAAPPPAVASSGPPGAATGAATGAAVIPTALAAYHRGAFGEAERLCRDAIAADLGRGEAHHLLGVIHARHGRQAEALASYDRALAQRPDDPQLLSNRGVALYELGRCEDALASYEQALALHPGFAAVLTNRGNALRTLRRFDEALASYDQALWLMPDFPEALSNRGTTLHDMGRYAAAIDSYDRALALRPDYADALANRDLAVQRLAATPPGSPPEGVLASEQMPAYAISLARRPDRRERFLRWNDGKGVDLRVFDAVDGHGLRRADLVRGNLVENAAIGFSDGALGNALSHRRLWQVCVDLGRPIMVLEDDAFLPDGIANWVAPICAELEQDCGILYLGYNRDAILSIGYGGQWCNISFERRDIAFDALVRQHNLWSRHNAHLFVDVRLAWGILGYAVAPRGAQALLRHCFPLSTSTPVRMYGSARLFVPDALDGIINGVIQRGLIRARAVFPPLIIGPNDKSDSDVGGAPTGG